MITTRPLLRLLYLLVLIGFVTPFLEAQNDVTFRVKMNIKMRELAFLPGSGDIVTVPGDFNSWNSAADTLRDPDLDSIYTKTVSLPTGGISYKFFKTLRGGIDWEGVDNRTYTVVSSSQTLPIVYFDNDSVYNPPTTDVPVTFQVNMRVKMLEGTFLPSSADFVSVPGGFNGWNTSVDTLRDFDGDSIYTKTAMIAEGQSIEYKFYKTARGGIDWESVSNRPYTVPTGGGTIPVAYFDNDSVVNTPISANIIWRIDMRPYAQIGWFVPATDSVQVRGGFEGWGGTRMTFDGISQTYRVTVPYNGTSFDQLPHKFYMKLDSVAASTRFPGYASDVDGVQYDHPFERGDGNRIFDVGNGGNISTPVFSFSSINQRGLLLNTTDTVRVTLQVNMGPAMRYIDPFDPATDTVKLVWALDAAWSFSQVTNQGTFPRTVIMTRNGPSDSVYSVSVKIKGKTHYGLMYVYRYIHGAGGSVDEGGGLGVQAPARGRFIQPLGANSFPATYTAPLDVWQKNPPMPTETAPFGITDVQEESNTGNPVAYKLLQNYPNPFNPATRIRYTIPERTNVTLKVFNLLGQEVVTLFNGEQGAGNYVALFESNKLASGIYFYRLQTSTFTDIKKMILLR